MLDVIQKRRTCRSFIDREVEQEKIDEIVKAGLLAPSGMNRQTSVIIVIKDKKTRDALMAVNRGKNSRWGDDFDTFYGAPVILLVIAHKDGLSLHDGAATMENMLLEATNQGLASGWIHRAEDEIQSEEGRKILSFTGLNFDEYVGVGHVILGYPNPEFEPKEKVIRENRVFIK
ncbi:MAG: nitroreductase [Bacilli bacterium]|nr:nitroreductase [Bacilli bacterium]